MRPRIQTTAFALFIPALLCACLSVFESEPTWLELTRVDGRPLPVSVGTSPAGNALVVYSGHLQRNAQNGDCGWGIKLDQSRTGYLYALFAGATFPGPCILKKGEPREITHTFDNADWPTGSHVYRFE